MRHGEKKKGRSSQYSNYLSSEELANVAQNVANIYARRAGVNVCTSNSNGVHSTGYSRQKETLVR